MKLFLLSKLLDQLKNIVVRTSLTILVQAGVTEAPQHF